MKKSDKKSLTIPSIILGVIFLCIGVFYGTYYFFIGKSNSTYITNVKTEITNINKTNENSTIFTKGDTIDVDTINKYLPKSISSLQSSQSKLQSLVVTNKYSDDHNNLLLGLEKNISLYKQILSIVRNTKSTSLNSYLVELQKNRNECVDHYSLVSIRGAEVMLPEETLKFLNNSIAFSKIQIKQNTDTQIFNSQNRDFLLSFDEISNKFTLIYKDYMNSVINARKSISGYEDLLKDIESVENILTEIKTNLSCLTIPKDALDLYKSFSNVVDEYELYLQNIKFAAKTEKLTYTSRILNNNSNTSNNTADKLYDTPKAQFKTVQNKYINYSKLYSEFENNTV